MPTPNIVKLLPNVAFEGKETEIADRERGYFIRGYVKRPNDDLTLLLQSCKHWAYVWHDKDDKEAHCHIIVYFANNKTPTALARILRKIDKVQNWHFSVLRDKYSAFDYLHHRDEKSVEAGKHRYPDGEVLTDDTAWFTRGGQSDRDNEAFYRDLIETPLSYAEMGRKYGRDYMKNYHAYDTFRKQVYYEEYAKEVVADCDKSNADWLEICFTVVKKAIRPYIAHSNSKPSDKFLYEQISRLFEDQILDRLNKGELQ